MTLINGLSKRENFNPDQAGPGYGGARLLRAAIKGDQGMAKTFFWNKKTSIPLKQTPDLVGRHSHELLGVDRRE